MSLKMRLYAHFRAQQIADCLLSCFWACAIYFSGTLIPCELLECKPSGLTKSSSPESGKQDCWPGLQAASSFVCNGRKADVPFRSCIEGKNFLPGSEKPRRIKT